MKVKDIMQKNVLFVKEDTSIKKLARLMFSTHISGFPVVRENKLVGFVTADDLFYRAGEVVGSSKTTASKSLKNLFSNYVKDVMIKTPVSVLPETPLSEAQGIMVKNYFANLPVVDKSNNLVGIISYSDVFREIISEEIPELEMDEYVSYVINHYDELVDWEKRFDLEFPTLFRIFNKHKVKKILDLGFWTGAYDIQLAKEGLNIVAVEHNDALVSAANEKKTKLPEKIKNILEFKLVNYSNLKYDFPDNSFGAVLCIGNALPYIPGDTLGVLSSAYNLLKKDGVLVIQLLNLERIVENRKRFHYFRIKPSRKINREEELFVEYYDKKNDNIITQNVITFSSNGKSWIYRGINSIDIKYIKSVEIEKLVKSAGFKDINITGNKGEEEGQYGQMSLVKPFDKITSEWMTIIAVKK